MQRFITRVIWGVILILYVTSFTSCIKHKELIMLNGSDIDIDSKQMAVYNEVQNFKAYKIQPFDQLMVKVNAFDGSTEEYLNREFTAENIFSRDISYDPSSLYFNSYTVDENGTITLPLVGAITVRAKTISEIKKELDEVYKPHLRLVSTTVKLANMRITILGEVHKPGVHYLNNEKNTLLDAISMAGDFTDFGNREKVKLIRFSEKSSQTIYLDLNKSDFINTEFYYVQPYDVIYIEPTKYKSRDLSAKVLGVAVSAISVGAVILSIFTR